jgi:pyrimidine operon attenuation protein/uracil phosphoribosyltransferase
MAAPNPASSAASNTTAATSSSATEAPDRGLFVARSHDPSAVDPGDAATVLTSADVRRALTRIAHEIVERNHGADRIVLIGLQNQGDVLARRLAAAIEQFEGVTIPVGALDVSFYRDDIGLRPVRPAGPTDVAFPIDGRIVVLVDDVLYTGRTIRAALDALTDLGRPRAVQLAVLVDRGHRELPIRPDFVGKNLPTHVTEDVQVTVTDTGADDGVVLVRKGPAPQAGPTADTADGRGGRT